MSIAAKERHPDLNPEDPNAEEHFKKITGAYTKALLVSSRRSAIASDSGPSAADASRAGYARTRTTWQPPPRTAQGPVDSSKFNTREWERQHYGMHGGTQQTHHADDRLRAMAMAARRSARQAQAREQSAAAARAARTQRGGHGMHLALSIVAASAAWYGVHKTVQSGRYKS